MKNTRILALALLLAVGTGFAASAQQDTTKMQKKTVKTTKVHKKAVKDSTNAKP